VYDKDIADGCTFKASVSLVNSFASGDQRNVCITEKEILDMSKDMTLFDVKGVVEQMISYRDPTQKQHYKSAGLGKKEMGEMHLLVLLKQAQNSCVTIWESEQMLSWN
jgi:hypothetical protein